MKKYLIVIEKNTLSGFSAIDPPPYFEVDTLDEGLERVKKYRENGLPCFLYEKINYQFEETRT